MSIHDDQNMAIAFGFLLGCACTFALFAWLTGRVERKLREIQEQVEGELANLRKDPHYHWTRHGNQYPKATLHVLPAGMTRSQCIQDLRVALDIATSKRARWPKHEALIDHIDQHGFPAPTDH